MKKPNRPSSAGFTLIELMIVVAIIGVLSSIAIPLLQNMTARGRLAERDPIMRAIAKGVEDFALNGSSVPKGFSGAYNPTAKPGTTKVPWVQAQPNWRDLPLIIEGATYCSYKFDLVDNRSPIELIVTGDCDIDGDGIHNTKIQTYDGYGNSFVLVAESAPSPATF